MSDAWEVSTAATPVVLIGEALQRVRLGSESILPFARLIEAVMKPMPGCTTIDDHDQARVVTGATACHRLSFSCNCLFDHSAVELTRHGKRAA
ncbi:hypothetical protein [Burkholderia lata]|uniref:hypothetical protein n=1 Tax=Burkholderia lata (strain ATCC 17760 / DSM 23089 / LMG 22485 / NCIMB 9086 / R18194 / 383) TaxID=482957 RepID=UPI00399B56B9